MEGIADKSVQKPLRLRLTVHGMVQGVGFRPFVYRTARAMGLAGHVCNAGDGVRIEVEGAPCQVTAFRAALTAGPPANARVDWVETSQCLTLGNIGFAVRESAMVAKRGLSVPPDLATCPECLAELRDPVDRRHRYPFLTCAACGPRYSILDALPYDRERTSMAGFALCPACAEEYAEPNDHRFHAEPIACAECGPWLSYGDLEGEDALAATITALRDGQIVAVKGIGGYHLLADAMNETALARLRKAKQRPSKPFALLVPDLETANRLCHLDETAVAMLLSPAAPIVLAPRRDGAAVAEGVAPGAADMGLMLPYSPLHHMLCADVGRPLVATSANRCGEPLVYDDATAAEALQSLVDGVLGHNRPIRRRVEDSVVRSLAGAPQILRLGRGLAPDVIHLPPSLAPDGPIVLALGGDRKLAPVLLAGQEAILAPHAGHAETLASEAALLQALEDLQRLHGVRAEAVACDEHPDYPTTYLAQRFGLPVVPVQHHAAHIASVIAEHGLGDPVLGLAWDGTGYGPDGTVWGGEALWMARDGWQRVARLRPFPLPGGEQAVREPWRVLVGLLNEAGLSHLMPVGVASQKAFEVVAKQVAIGLNTAETSSMGRLFDGVAALLGLCTVSGHEGEAAMRLEACARRAKSDLKHTRYALPLLSASDGTQTLDWQPLMESLAHDLAKAIPVANIALGFHEALAHAVLTQARAFDAPRVVLSGGCFQNRLLTERTVALLEADGRRVYLNRRVPPGDGGLALGQALLARRRLALSEGA